MKLLRLLALAAVVCTAFAATASACDKDAKNASASASHDCCASAAKGTSATAASMTKGAACSAEMKAACAKGASRTAAMNASMSSGCAMHGTAATTASNACGMHGASAVTAANGHSCAMHGSTVTAANSKCAYHTNAVAGECGACDDWAKCDEEARALGATLQVVPLKNGSMIVYTAEGVANVHALQALVARHNDRILDALSAGDNARLCTDCKRLRGALASGKLSREVVNVERGCMTLFTSSDRAVAEQIHELTAPQLASR